MTRRISDCLKISRLICDAIIYKNRLNDLLSRSFFETNTLKLTTLLVELVVADLEEIIRQPQKHKNDKNPYISNLYQESLNFIDTRFFTASTLNTQNGDWKIGMHPVLARLWGEWAVYVFVTSLRLLSAALEYRSFKRLVNLRVVAYSSMTLLSYSDERFSGYQSASAQEIRFEIGQCIQADIIFNSFVELLETAKKPMCL